MMSPSGELALLKNAPRAATVTATQDTACVKILRDDFKRVLGSLAKVVTAIVTVVKPSCNRQITRDDFKRMLGSLSRR